MLSNDGSGWQVDQSAEAALGGAVPERVAGLPDGGAVIASDEGVAAGEGAVIEREGASAPWQPAPGGSPGYPAALAAIREGGQVRAIVSVAKGQGGEDLGSDSEQVFKQPPPGQAPLLSDPYPLPGSGLVLRQTATGWRDEQHQAFPLQQAVEGQTAYDLPTRPDPVLALLISPDGSQGWAVGGETGTFVRFQGEGVQTAGVLRYGAEAAPPSNASATAIPLTAGTANFALGGNAQCAGPCADLTGTGIGPDRWLAQAVGKAAGIPGMRAFLYTGPGVASAGAGPSERLGATLSPSAFGREEAAYAQRLGSAAGALPTFAAPAETDLDKGGSLAAFQTAFSGFGAPLGSAFPGVGIEPLSAAGPGQGYYSFASAGSGGTVRVIVLDYSASSLGATQSCWLAGQLSAAGSAGTPAIVVGQRDLAGQAPNTAKDAAQVVPILTGAAAPPGCGAPTAASAYFFDYPEQNRQYSLTAGGRSIPAFGSGTLGYVASPRRQETDFVGASGFLIVSVNAAARNPLTNVAPVSARLIPGIGALALDATDGTLLRRSHQALFEALARRPLGGSRCTGNFAPRICETQAPDPYIPIPTECRGQRCSTGFFPEYTFTSSNPDIADFVAHDPASLNPRNVQLVNDKPVLSSTSGLLCAFNAGTTTVTITAGGLTYSRKVTVLAGSVQRPCGTTPLSNRVAAAPAATVPPPPAPAPAPVSPAPTLDCPWPYRRPLRPRRCRRPLRPRRRPRRRRPRRPSSCAPPNPTPLVPIVPPPPAPAFQPTPPSGTAPVGATEDEEEEEEAYDLVSQMTALPHDPRPAAANAAMGGGGGGEIRLALPALVLLAAVAGAAGLRGARPRRGARPNLAYEATTTPRRYR